MPAAVDRRIRVVLVVLEGSVLFDIGTVVTVFGPARPGSGRPDLGYDLTLATAHPGPVTTSAGIPLHVAAGLDALGDADLVDCALRHVVATDAYGIATNRSIIDALRTVFPDAEAVLARYGIRPQA